MTAPVAPYSLGAKSAEGWVYTAGLVSVDALGATVGVGDIAVQTRQVLRILQGVVEAAQGTLSDVISVQIFLKDFAHYDAMNAVYREVFAGNPFPPRYCIRADLVKDEWLVEMTAVAKVG